MPPPGPADILTRSANFGAVRRIALHMLRRCSSDAPRIWGCDHAISARVFQIGSSMNARRSPSRTVDLRRIIG